MRKVEEVVAPSKEERNLIAYDEDYIVQLGSHNYEDFNNMVLGKSNSSTVVWLVYASKPLIRIQPLFRLVPAQSGIPS